MFYQEALPKFRFLSCVDSLLTIRDRHWATFEKAESASSLPFARNGCLFMWGVYFCMGAYKRDVVVVIKMGVYTHGVLILCGCLLSQFYGTNQRTALSSPSLPLWLVSIPTLAYKLDCCLSRSKYLVVYGKVAFSTNLVYSLSR